MNSQDLQQLLYKEIPITQAMGIEVLTLTNTNVQIKAPFESNKNIHNTAFAGSIYTTATLAGWSLVTNLLDCQSLPGSVVLAKAEIVYQKPINSDIIARCQLPDEQQMNRFYQRLDKKGRARLTLDIELVEAEQIKAKMIGQFAALR